MPYASPKDPRRVVSQHRYNTSEKGRKAMLAWRNAHRGRLAQYYSTDKAKEWMRTSRQRMQADPERKRKNAEAQRRYNQSEKGRLAFKRREASNRVKLGLGPPRQKLSPEEKKQRRKESLLRYRESGKAKVCQDRFYATEYGKQASLVRVERRRCLLMSVGGTFTSDEWRAMLRAFGYRCTYCGCGGKMTIDHVVPISSNGRHERANIVPSCLRCNIKKHKHDLAVACARLTIDLPAFNQRRAAGLARLDAA